MRKSTYFSLISLLALALLLAACGGDDEGDDNNDAATAAPTATQLEPPTENAVEWVTETVSLTADNFYIQTPNNLFTAQDAVVNVDSNPDSETSTTLEVTWQEHDVEMGIFMYFEVVDGNWQASEIRIYNGQEQAEWVDLLTVDSGPAFTTPLGQAYGTGSFSYGRNNFSLTLQNLSVQAFTNLDASE